MFAPQLLYEHCTFFVREKKWKRAKKATNISNADEKTRNIDDFCGFAIATEYTYTYWILLGKSRENFDGENKSGFFEIPI